jgi:hypothetical protein
MEWSVIGTGVGVVGLVYTMMRNLRVDLKSQIDKVALDVKSIDQNLRSIDHRLSKLEGSFAERGNWEGRLYAMNKNTTEMNAKTDTIKTH